MRLKLREKAAILFVLCAIIPLIAVSFGSYYSARTALKNKVDEELYLVAWEVLEGLERRFAESLTDLQSWGHLQIMQDVLIDDDDGEIATELAKLKGQFSFYSELLVLNEEGRVIATSENDGSSSVDSSAKLWSIIWRNDTFHSQLSEDDPRPQRVSMFASPITADYDEATVIGVLVGVIDWSQVRHFLSTASVAGAEQDSYHLIVLQSLTDNGVLYATPAMTGAVQSALTRDSVSDSEEGRTEVVADGGTYRVSDASSMGMGDFFDPHWSLRVAIADEVAFASVAKLRDQALIVGGLAFIFAVAIGIFCAHSIVRPIGMITSTLKHLAERKENVSIPDIPLNRNDEIGDMSRAFGLFKENAEARLKAEAELKELNEELEQRVEKRTEQLHQAMRKVTELNESLEHRVEERTAELHAAQKELVQGERLAALGQLTATVSHELRNPLGALRTSLFLIQSKTKDLDVDLSRPLARSERSIERCTNIVSEMLDFVRATDIDPETASIDAWLDAVIEEQKMPDGITLERESGAADLTLSFDGDRLRRAVINVFENGCQAMMGERAEGSVLEKEYSITIQTGVFDGRFEMRFIDNGSGMDEETLARIFEPLFSTKSFGVGLGMPTVKQIMELHDGGIEMKSQPGEGTTAVLWLPLPQEAANAKVA